MPASETVDFEREFAELVRELRAVPSEAPPELRERVRALGEPAPRRAFTRPRLSRRAVLMLAPACAVALATAAVVYGLVSSSSPSTHQEAAATVPTSTLSKQVHGAGEKRSATQRGVFGPATETQPFALTNAVGAPAPNPNRYQNYQASLRVRVKDFDALGKRSAQAMQITQALGGYVASIQQSTTSGSPGEADLVLRVPVGHVQAAMIRLSALGTVLEQHVSIQDLNAVVNAQRQRILQLKIEIARITATLQQSLPADVRLRLQFQLDDAKRSLANVTGANASTLRAAAMSRIALSLTTEKTAVAKHHRSFLGRSTHAAFTFLAGAGAIALAALIVLSPLLVIAVLFVLGLRAYRRREERRLLAAAP
jgi:Domain of unknown function (DUF4349)